MNIKRGDFVLEIGSGDNPKARSDVLCDKLPLDDTERGGKIVLDRPFIAADGQHLPFKDGSFDYVICCHVLEHVEDPELFFSELMRVGKAGYIETPSEIGERLYGWEYHKWFVNLIDSKKLVLKRKDTVNEFGLLFHYIYKSDPIYAKFHTNNPQLFLVQYEWFGKIDYEIVDSKTVVIDLNDEDVIRKLLTRHSRSSSLKNLVPKGVKDAIKSMIVKGSGRSRKTIQDIRHIIVCPKCKGELQWGDDLIYCSSCDKTYQIVNGIPFLLV